MTEYGFAKQKTPTAEQRDAKAMRQAVLRRVRRRRALTAAALKRSRKPRAEAG